MISYEKISIRAKSEDEAINKAYETLRAQNKLLLQQIKEMKKSQKDEKNQC